MSKDISPFDIFRNTLTATKRELTPDEEKAYSPLFTNRILSMSPSYVMEANLANWLLGMGMDAKTHHMFLRSFLPSRRIPIDYIKKPKGETDRLKDVMVYYECGRRDAAEIMGELDEKELEKISKAVDFMKS